MNIIQKRSWYTLTLYVLFLFPAIAFLLAGWSPAGWAAVVISFPLLLMPLLFRAKKGRHEYDEMAQSIRTNAADTATTLTILLVILLCMGFWSFSQVRGQDTVHVNFLVLVVVLMGVCFNISYAVSILSQYRKNGC